MQNEKSVDVQIIEMYRNLVAKKHPDFINGWPVLTGHNIKRGSFGGWTIIIFEHTGNPVMKTSSGIGEISSAIIGYNQITDDNKISVKDRITCHFRLSRREFWAFISLPFSL